MRENNQVIGAVIFSVEACILFFSCLIVTQGSYNPVKYGKPVYTLVLLVIYGLMISIVPALCVFFLSKTLLRKLGKESWFAKLVLVPLAAALGAAWAFFCFYANIYF